MCVYIYIYIILGCDRSIIFIRSLVRVRPFSRRIFIDRASIGLSVTTSVYQSQCATLAVIKLKRWPSTQSRSRTRSFRTVILGCVLCLSACESGLQPTNSDICIYVYTYICIYIYIYIYVHICIHYIINIEIKKRSSYLLFFFSSFAFLFFFFIFPLSGKNLKRERNYQLFEAKDHFRRFS